MHADKQTLLWGCGPIKSDLISSPMLSAPSTSTLSFPHPMEHTTQPAVTSAANTPTHKHMLLTAVAPPTPPCVFKAVHPDPLLH